jgi:Secretion system C-terminal sorting domain/FG-GAP-like repeat
MKKTILIFLLFYSIVDLNAQPFNRMNVEFQKFGEQLKYALAGGLNTPQFSAVDLNNDGLEDLYIFERTGDLNLTFINNGTADQSDYEYAPYYQQFFPQLNDWAMLRDYNGDGVMDIFAFSDIPGVEGIIVYTGSYSNNHLAFERYHFASQEFNYDLIPFQTGGGLSNLYVSFIDYPAIDDIDGDGDLDVVTFALGGGHVYLFENRSVEMGFGQDSLKYILKDICWGRFYESGLSEIIDLSPDVDSCSFGFVGDVAEDRHAGSTLLTLDIDNDNDKELILGDLSFNNLNMLYNGGDNEFAFMVDQDTFSPKNTLVADIPIFPASFFMDVNNDGLKDLLASPNSSQTGEDYNAVWFYKNINSNEFPVFQYVQKDFMIEDMVDLGTDAHPTFLDYNADGLLDLVVGNLSFYQPFGERAPRIYLFENTGTANSPKFNLVDDDYLEFSQYSGTNNYAPSPTFGDLDNDGDLDVLIGEKSGSFFYGENTAGPGNPVAFDNLQFGYMGLDIGQNSVPQIVDLDRDGLPDIITGERIGKVSYFHNEGTQNDPFFLPNIDSQTPAGENIIVLGLIDTRFGSFTGRAAPVILDFDGEYHIFTGSQAGYLMRYSNIDGNIDGTFTLESDYYGEIREGFNTRPAIADIDDDGILEMFVGNERGGLSLFKTNLHTDGTPVSTNYIYNKPEIFIYPNPANDFFNIEIRNGNNSLVNISLFNAIGQEVSESSFTSSSFQVNCANLSDGIYFARIERGGELVVKKVVIGK